jgi:hypothetical protein
MTGTLTACFSAAMASQLALPPYFCTLVRPCRAISAAPFCAKIRPISKKFSCVASQPSRILPVTGTERCWLSSLNVSAMSAGWGIMPTPAPRPLTLRVAQPMLTSMMSGPHSWMRRAASSSIWALLPKIWNTIGCSPGCVSSRMAEPLVDALAQQRLDGHKFGVMHGGTVGAAQRPVRHVRIASHRGQDGVAKDGHVAHPEMGRGRFLSTFTRRGCCLRLHTGYFNMARRIVQTQAAILDGVATRALIPERDRPVIRFDNLYKNIYNQYTMSTQRPPNRINQCGGLKDLFGRIGSLINWIGSMV